MYVQNIPSTSTEACEIIQRPRNELYNQSAQSGTDNFQKSSSEVLEGVFVLISTKVFFATQGQLSGDGTSCSCVAPREDSDEDVGRGVSARDKIPIKLTVSQERTPGYHILCSGRARKGRWLADWLLAGSRRLA